ncbi:accessory factor UbiK family protein [Candidatus Kirkpatrickella diaphorinae]|uniref:Accessory factor UbiK family protein n=1 Tax=Candidatus Kirkpatrickella diaphorinae TaxID=2984322 RepID=A0ABY6GJA6_9PROT|nr:accessory factor UbiK family protein [Candidatus Kirkpatrickella diaphorinae]UYH51344.1 accessory factor UbiK family protein [Candidatus Kirkpatrickella diaphorinae]
MRDRPRIFDDMSGLAGGAFSALTGLREELKALVQNRVDEFLARLEVVRREEFDAMVQMASHSRMETERLAQQVKLLQDRLNAGEAHNPSTPKKKPASP